MDFGPASLAALSNLLTTPEENSDSEDEKPESGYKRMGPGDIGSKADALNKNQSADQNKDGGRGPSGSKDAKEIWEQNEVPLGSEHSSTFDPRPQPAYEIMYRQSVGSEDVFLQMGNKTPATASCEEMVIKIFLPETEMRDVELDVRSKFLDCRTPKYYLGLHLPHPVDAKTGKAQWDQKNCKLHVTLRPNREYDFMNF